MSKQTSKEDYKIIDRSSMDAVLHGISKSLDYMGEQKQVILDKMGDLMLEYLVEIGAIKSHDKPKQFVSSFRKLLTKNGYSSRIPIEFNGTPPRPSIPNFVNYLMPKDRGASNTRISHSKNRSKGSKRKIDWELFETALYGITEALDDELGAQAQIILDRIGTEIVNYLVEKKLVEPSDGPGSLFLHVIDYFIIAGYARDLEFKWEGSPPNSFESTYQSARYFNNVFSRLRNQGSALLSCPLCLAGHSIFARGQGIKFQDALEYRILPGNRVFMRSRIFEPDERFTEEDAKKIS